MKGSIIAQRGGRAFPQRGLYGSAKLLKHVKESMAIAAERRYDSSIYRSEQMLGIIHVYRHIAAYVSGEKYRSVDSAEPVFA